MAVFYEIEEVGEQKKTKRKKGKKRPKIQCTNMTARAFQKMILRPGANITVMGVGGAGRNAIKNMRELGMERFVRLVAIDTDIGCDRLRYHGSRKGGGKK